MKKVIVTVLLTLIIALGSYFAYNLLTNMEVFQFELNSGEKIKVMAHKSLYIINVDKIETELKNNECISFFSTTVNNIGSHLMIMPYGDYHDNKRVVNIYYQNGKVEKVFSFIINTKDKIVIPDLCK